MGRDNLPNLKSVTDQLRIDNHAIGRQAEAFIVGAGHAAQPTPAVDSDDAANSNGSENHTRDRCATSDVFPWMRAYGCLGRKASDEK